MLRNRFYVGEVRYKNEIFHGPQPPLLDRELFEAVQAKLTEQWSHRTATRNKSAALLSGLLFDDAGHPMTPTHATKNGVRYRYYVSQPYLRGLARSSSSSVGRVPAADIEAAVIKALASHLGDRNRHKADRNQAGQNQVDRSTIAANVARIEVRKSHLAIQLKAPDADGDSEIDRDTERDLRTSGGDTSGSSLLVPWCKPPSRKAREILLPPSVPRHTVRPIKAERRTALLKAIARGRGWLDEIVSGASQGVEQIAARHKCSIRHVNMTISMAFIAPALVRAAIEGRLPRGIGVAALRDPPAEWSRQFERLGLPQPD
jgi:site-specific DNA recombinase